MPAFSVPSLSTYCPFMVLCATPESPLSEVATGASVRVPAPALMTAMAPLLMPLPPLIGEVIVRSPIVHRLSGEKVLV